MNNEVWNNRVKDAIWAIINGKDILATLISAKVDEILKKEGGERVEILDYSMGEDSDGGISVFFDDEEEDGKLEIGFGGLQYDEVITIAERLMRGNYSVTK